jgi:DNA-binding transcriptional LysR family regulator
MSERWVLYPPGSLFDVLMMKAFHDNGLVPPPAAVSTSSLSMRISLLATGHFLSMVPAGALKFFAKHTGIKALSIGTGEIYLVEDMHSKGHRSQALGLPRRSLMIPIE